MRDSRGAGQSRVWGMGEALLRKRVPSVGGDVRGMELYPGRVGDLVP